MILPCLNKRAKGANAALKIAGYNWRMKFLPSQLYYFLRHRPSRVQLLSLFRFLLILTGVIALYSILFHYIMAWEGRSFSWITGFYWTLTVMSTLGFGDITFHSDLGRLFSIIVLLTGIVLLLVLLPFTFIEFFYAPWVKAQSEARAPTRLPEKSHGHVIITSLDAVTRALIKRLELFHYPYVLLVADRDEALRLHDLGYAVVRGDLDSPETYRRIQVENAALVATSNNDMMNTNVAFTVREVSESVPIVSTANASASIDILYLAGCNYVFRLGEMMGQALSRRVSGGDTLAHVIGEFEELVIAEAAVRDTPLVGKQLRHSRLREDTGILVLGVWLRGQYENAGPDTVITADTILVLAGSAAQMQRYNELYYHQRNHEKPVVILGGGRVGRATARTLLERGLDYRIVDKLPERIRDPEKYVLGDAADLSVLEKAGIRETDTVVVTTNDDNTNIYLTIYCRRLRPDIQIISRATLERNVETLHRAGADFVMSYASMGTNEIMRFLDRGDILMVAEGLGIFKVKTPKALHGKSIAAAAIRQETGCTVIALKHHDDTIINPDPQTLLFSQMEMVLIGAANAEDVFLRRYQPVEDG